MNTDAAYVEIIHLSDLHFGDHHVFTMAPTADGAAPAALGMPTLADKLVADLTDENLSPFPSPEVQRVLTSAAPGSEDPEFVFPSFPRILCISGDLTQQSSLTEFQQAERLIRRLQEALNISADATFVCPGNHDLNWTSTDDSVRWDQYANFLTRLTGTVHRAQDAAMFGGVKVCTSARTVVLSLNTEMKVLAEDGEKSRGDLHPMQLAWARRELEALPIDVREHFIKVAMVHHHPVLLPSSAESGRGYDAISGADKLLPLLHEHGFQVILHGHKHYPHTFREDVRNAFVKTSDHSLFIVAGGTCGSSELPSPKIATQCYNRVRIHWCAKEGTTRVQVATRGLVTLKPTGQELMADQWHWTTLSIDDRHHIARRLPQIATPGGMRYGPRVETQSAANVARVAEYKRTAGNFPVAEILPAMLPGQTAEVHLRIVAHNPELVDADHVLRAVTWSGGDRWFPSVYITRDEDPHFHAIFAYWGGSLIQAELHFANAPNCVTHVYVPMLTSQTATGTNGADHVRTG